MSNATATEMKEKMWDRLRETRTRVPGRESRNQAHVFSCMSLLVRVSELVRPQKSFAAAAVASASDSFVKLNHARGAMRTDEQDNFRHSIQARPPLKGGRKRVRERGANC